MSMFARTDPDAVVDGLADLRRDVTSGVWGQRYADLASAEELDAGYRLLIVDLDTT